MPFYPPAGSGGGGGSLSLIKRFTTVDNATTQFDFASIPATALALLLLGNVRTVNAGGSENLNVVLNADAGVHYETSVVSGNGTAAASTRSTGNNQWRIPIIPGSAVAPSGYSPVVCWIPNTIADPTYKLASAGLSGYQVGTNTLVEEFLNEWAPTAGAQISDLLVSSGTGAAFVVGCTLALYGLQ